MHEITIRVSRRAIERVIFLFIILILFIFGFFYYFKAHKLEKDFSNVIEKQNISNQVSQEKQDEKINNTVEQPEKEEQKPDQAQQSIEKEQENELKKETGEFKYEGIGIDLSVQNISIQKISTKQAKLKMVRLAVMNGKDTEEYLYADLYVYDSASDTEEEIEYNDYFSKKVRQRLTIPKLNPKTKLVKDYPLDISLYHLDNDQILKIILLNSENKAIKTIIKTFKV